MLKEFRDFIAKGNVMDMAIGVVMATAFTAIVNSLVEDIIMPIVAFFTGSTDFTDIVLQIGNTKLMVGNFIQSIVSFLIIALVLFFVMKGVATLKNTFMKEEKVDDAEEEAKPSQEEILLTEIRDLLKNK
ncbi:large conductance mechanosensitive channel protein MscL [Aerococcus sp. UMB10185]|uniref:large conductance mechanosensitive channel protein MscL n=1 Tax=unclassified Aerococcus TaxID=2618060 RepID=UPI0008A46F24|nr:MULTISPECIES: large conductance mechanosensitive channel protein MscL [unclassified Aerococcus]KAB0646271.1 large conductance mechanosensitive channel protein MscL [Aerococcus sanguinicola]MDK6233104.1 large conductance mechanosensitive channel protein MscL [Aerococcus sp. UMB10185]MDK6804778.1 large conductance mechanosensitive channel protein MscL [Aerococcus sp. UMB7834]MDK6855690.1 large conductance mechanosensitive channel protein MscL [Aerococcus sp. UMB7533]MDK8502467.1 large conduct